MNVTKIVSIIILSTTFMFNTALAEGEKLKDKLSKGAIILSAEIKDCDADAKQHYPGLDPGSQKALMCCLG